VRHDDDGMHSVVEIVNELSTVWRALEGAARPTPNEEHAMSVTLESVVTSKPVVTAQVVSADQPRRR
jgi:hypothetical protein